MNEKKITSQVIFANQLRVLAFLSVVIVHWVTVFWLARDQIASYIGGDPVTGNSALSEILQPPIINFNYGPFGVALFFLISGFVIPFSIKSRSKFGFIAGRFFRIYPVYWVALTITIATIYITKILFFNEETLTNISLPIVISNMLLINNILGHPSIDWVNWTLAIEFKFYLLCLFFYNPIKKEKTSYILLASTAIILFIIMIPDGYSIRIPLEEIGISAIYIDAIKQDILFIPYMLIGSVIYYNYIGSLSMKRSLFLIAILVVCFSLSWPSTNLKEQYPSITTNYLYALIVFYICFLLREKFKSNKIIDFLANQTFTFYVLHSIIGYSLLKIMYSLNINYVLSLAVTFISVLVMSIYLNKTIEKWAINQGKKYR